MRLGACHSVAWLQFAEFIKKETVRYGKVIREANLSIE